MNKTLELHAIHRDELDFYKNLLGNQLTFISRDCDWYYVKDGFFNISNEQHTILLLRDPEFMTCEQEQEYTELADYQQRRDNILAERNARKLQRKLKNIKGEAK